MAVAEMGVPTGFDADLESITKHDFIKKIETQDRKVIFYFDQIFPVPYCVTMDAVRTGLVAKSKPVAVRVYDYYQPVALFTKPRKICHNQVTKFYESNTLKSSSICDVCESCGCPVKGK